MVTVPPEDGYGAVQKELVQEMPRERFPEDVELTQGMIFQAETPHGMVNFQVAEVTDEAIVADFNHPLAGKTLHFDIKVAEVRESTEEDRKALSGHEACDDGCCGCGGA